MTEFFQTGMGRDFYEHTIPALVKAINTLALEMKRANDLKREELDRPKE